MSRENLALFKMSLLEESLVLIKRSILIVLGFIFLGTGIIGIFLPLLPTTPFLLLTALCFNASSPKFHHWLYHHKVFGPPIQDWQKNRVIGLRSKITATSMLALSSYFIFQNVKIPTVGKLFYASFVLVLLGFLWTRKSRA
jgi:uncharacterized membrane protein YbaN (DUF454 family)